MIQTANQTPGFYPNCTVTQKPTGEGGLCVACAWDELRNPQWENNANRGNCITANEAFMHVHIRATQEEQEEHMETNTKRCSRTDDPESV